MDTGRMTMTYPLQLVWTLSQGYHELLPPSSCSGPSSVYIGKNNLLVNYLSACLLSSRRNCHLEYMAVTNNRASVRVSRRREKETRWRVPEELLTILFIQPREDVLYGVLVAGDNNVLDGVDTTVGQLDHLIQDNEGSLQIQDGRN